MELKITIDATQDVLDAITQLTNAIKGLNVTATTETVTETVVTEKPKKVTKVKEEIAEEVVPVPLPVEETTKTTEATRKIYIEDIRAKVQIVAQNGKREEVKMLLSEFGVTRVSDLDSYHFTEFYSKVNAL
jgi:intergrase/recombinase